MSGVRVHWLSHALWILPVVAFLTLWEVMGRGSQTTAFFFSYPSQVIGDLFVGLARDGLLRDLGYTVVPAVGGLFSGAIVGGASGFALVRSQTLALRLSPLVAFLGAFPVFAIAPMTLVWFGLGLEAKYFLAFLSCVFVFLQAAYAGGLAAPEALTRHFSLHGFSGREEFIKLRLPFALDWLLTAFKTAANLALLGVFIGEFIASEHGLARVMLDSGGLYNVKRVLAAAVLFALAAVAMGWLADLVKKLRIPLLRLVSVPAQSRERKG